MQLVLKPLAKSAKFSERRLNDILSLNQGFANLPPLVSQISCTGSVLIEGIHEASILSPSALILLATVSGRISMCAWSD